jgi:hypothetical protein
MCAYRHFPGGAISGGSRRYPTDRRSKDWKGGGGFFQGLEKSSAPGSKAWKEAGGNFQALEKLTAVFPRLGKSWIDFSEPWKRDGVLV